MEDYTRLTNETGRHAGINSHRKMQIWWILRTKLERFLIIGLSVILIAVFSLIFYQTGIGRFKCKHDHRKPYTNYYVTQNLQQQESISDELLKSTDKSIIKSHLRNLTKNYHPAGSEANLEVMDYIANKWRAYGFDRVETEEYQVLLSYPVSGNPNTVFALDDASQKWTLLSNGTSTPLGPTEALEQQHDEDAKLWWNAFSQSGTVNGTVIYAGYCSSRDFKTVAQLRGTDDLTGNIILCRYGFGWRGGKVYEAEKRNASGVLLYLDPANYGPPRDCGSDDVFPNSIYVPASGAQRGTLSQIDGDPQTPLFPSKDYTYRYYNEQELRNKLVIPNIPVTPLGYGDALKIFSNMKDGMKAPDNFTGGLNVTYYLNTTTLFQLNVHVTTVQKKIKNVFGYIYGQEEIDRLVLLGNHVDAWTYGAFDPNSGTAAHLAVSHALMKVINATKWRPRRTILFAAWDAEEYGLIGSQEWVEQKLHIITNRVVAVINTDTGIQGNETLSIKAVPLLYRAILNASKKVPNPNPIERSKSRPTVYDSWLFYRNDSLLDGQSDLPYMSIPGGGSDFKPFLQYAGIPVCDVKFDHAKEISAYPLYHTMYEIDWTMEHLYDIEFETSLALARLVAEVARNLADSLVIPFNITDYALILKKHTQLLVKDLKKVARISRMIDNFDDICSNLTKSVEEFYEKGLTIQQLINKANSGVEVTVGLVERINARLMMLERAFITPPGLPGRPLSRHVFFATSEKDSYASLLYAGIRDTLKKYKKNTTDTELRKTLNLQFTVARYSIESAIDVLKM